jgi:hypothetical protein
MKCPDCKAEITGERSPTSCEACGWDEDGAVMPSGRSADEIETERSLRQREAEDAKEPRHVHAQRWLRRRYGAHVFAPFSSQDWRAFVPALYAILLWCGSDNDNRRRAVDALRALVGCMQPHTRNRVRAAIPALLDWGHEAELWPLVVPDDQAAPLVPLPGMPRAQ